MESLVADLDANGAVVMYERPHVGIMLRRFCAIEHGPIIIGIDFGSQPDPSLHLCRHRLLRNLISLTTNSRDISDRHVQFLSGCTAIRELDLRGTRVSDSSLSILAELSSLEVLDLRDTNVSLNGAAKIRESLPRCRVLR
jgi:hypothetical protein